MLTEFLVIGLLVLINGFFALSEMALVSASKPLLRQMFKQGSRRAGIALSLVENPGRFLSTVQVGITFVGIMTGAYGGATLVAHFQGWLSKNMWFSQSMMAAYSEEAAYGIGIFGITYFSIIAGELVPKQFALKRAEQVAMLVAPFMLAITWCVYPLVRILDVSGGIFLKIFGLTPSEHDPITEEEVKAVIAEGKETGIFEQSEHEMLQRIMRLGDRDVRSFMTPRVDMVALSNEETLQTVRYTVMCNPHSRYPVVNGDLDHIVGIVDTRDILSLPIEDEAAPRWQDLMHPVTVVPEHASGLQALELFKRSPISLAIIVDEYGSTQGMITAADILEAIVGMLPSNYDSPDYHIRDQEDGSWLVDGIMPIHEVAMALSMPEPGQDVEYQTIAGLVLYHLSKEPEEGDSVEFQGFKIDIIDMDGRRIDKVRVRRK